MYEEAHYEKGGSKLVEVVVLEDLNFAVGRVSHFNSFGEHISAFDYLEVVWRSKDAFFLARQTRLHYIAGKEN